MLYLDEHVPRAITAGLRSRSVDVLTVQENGRAAAPDPDILDRAAELGRVVFTQHRAHSRCAASRRSWISSSLKRRSGAR